MPSVTYVPPSTVTVPPPLSDLIAAEELPVVWIERLEAFIVPPPVVMRPPEQFPDVVITESLIFTVVPSPYENTALACLPFVSTTTLLSVSVALSVAKTAALSP